MLTKLGPIDFPPIYSINPGLPFFSYILQLLRGKKAEMCIPSLPVDPNHHLQYCREISNKGDKIVVGNGKGIIQVVHAVCMNDIHSLT